MPKLELKRNPTSNNYCVPAAVALISGLHVDTVIEKIREDLGDQPISGLYYPLGLKILVQQGFDIKRVDLTQVNIGRLHKEKFYYCCNSHHCFVLHDGLLWDNGNPDGLAVGKFVKVNQIWECFKPQ